MPQLVGECCVTCSKMIVVEPVAGFCADCRAVVHTECLAALPGRGRTPWCTSCAQKHSNDPVVFQQGVQAEGAKAPGGVSDAKCRTCPECRMISPPTAIECSDCGWGFNEGRVTGRYNKKAPDLNAPDGMIRTGGAMCIAGMFIPILGLVGVFILAIGVKRKYWGNA